MLLGFTLLGVLGGQEILIILIIVLVLFGGKKIPELMRGLGRGVKEFKEGMNGVNFDSNQPNTNNNQEQKPQNQNTQQDNSKSDK
ncbi:MAG: twin-arginine translocase TatA/TatE family subunit [Bacteroidales bacterium]|nr:twin-arginine translocase TatA/TatE family subunit [Bacteroidales bacterium]